MSEFPAIAADGSLRVEIADDNDKPVPCQVYLHDAVGKPIRAPGLPFWHDHFVCDGTFELTLPAGTYGYEIERGPEYRPLDGSVTVRDSRRTTENARLARIADLASDGWYSGELHVHRPVEEIPLLMQAADLHVAPVITWWNATNLWADREPPAATLNRFDGNRYYDLMAGEDEREGGALLFFGLKKPLAITTATREYPSPLKFVAEARARGGVWMDIEKPFWWDVPVWLAAGVADSIGIANNHMCRSTMYENEAWGKPRDAKQLPSPLGNGYWSQEIYYHALNCGFRLPPSAGSASGVLPNPMGYNRVYVHTDQFSHDSWWDGLKAGRSFVTNGPLLIARANGQLPGHVFSGTAGSTLEIGLDISLLSNDHVSAINIIKSGEAMQTVVLDDGTSSVLFDATSYQGNIGKITFDKSGWFLIRAVTDIGRTFRFASTAPYYVEIGADKRRISRKSAQFFLDWTIERAGRVPNKLKDPAQLSEVLEYHNRAREYWEKKVAEANDV